MNIYVGNLSYDVVDQDLQAAFSTFGEVESAKVVTDRDTGRSRGFGFVEMQSQEQGQAAIEALNGTSLKGREITVNEARPRDDRSGGGDRSFSSRGGQGQGRGNRW